MAEEKPAPDNKEAAPETDTDKEKNKHRRDKKEDKAAAELEKLKAELAEAQDKLLYLQADYQNYRKRSLKDISDARANGTAGALEPFLSINDFLGMAQHAAEKSDNVEAIKQGILMIIGEYRKAMDELGVTRISCTGKKFDPDFCEAVGSEASETVPEGMVIREFSGGYKMGERLLRPARVVVSTGKPAAEAENAEDAAGNDEKSEA